MTNDLRLRAQPADLRPGFDPEEADAIPTKIGGAKRKARPTLILAVATAGATTSLAALATIGFFVGDPVADNEWVAIILQIPVVLITLATVPVAHSHHPRRAAIITGLATLVFAYCVATMLLPYLVASMLLYLTAVVARLTPAT